MILKNQLLEFDENDIILAPFFLVQLQKSWLSYHAANARFIGEKTLDNTHIKRS
jgi:hypothetical protein